MGVSQIKWINILRQGNFALARQKIKRAQKHGWLNIKLIVIDLRYYLRDLQSKGRIVCVFFRKKPDFRSGFVCTGLQSCKVIRVYLLLQREYRFFQKC